MDSRWQRIEEAVWAAVELPPADRSAWLDKFCDGNRELRAEIDSLLSAEVEADNFLEHSAAPYVASLLEEDYSQSAPAKIGQYRIVHEIGRGGMGVVYLAERDDQFNQQVAIKLVKRGLDTEEILQRFGAERQILASLNHPNIARLFDGGMTQDGLPYFVMEYIAGEPLTRYANQNDLAIDDKLKLFLHACAAVQHAHQNLIVHRDLKPSNILVTADREVKLLDFGVAKLLTSDSDGDATMTQAPQRVMTPQYASPEQIRGQRVTTATDVYSLGVVLYEMLTSSKPYRLKETSPEELARAICETEPVKPSEARSELPVSAGGPIIDKRAHQSGKERPSVYAGKSLRGDLDNIVLMAMRKDPERRYKSVEQFSADIKRYLDGRPVLARKDTFSYRVSKFAGRNKIAVTATAVVLLAIVIGLVISVWQGRVAARERNVAREEQAKAEELNKFLQSILLAASPEEKGPDAKVIEVVRNAAERLKTEFDSQPALKAQALLTIGTTYNNLGLGDEAKDILREALRLNQALHGENSNEAGLCKIQLSVPLLNNGRYDEAESLLQDGIAAERKFAANGKDLATGLAILGELYVRRTQFDKAKPPLQEALKLFDQLAGPNNENSAVMLVSLGRAQYFSGDVPGAEATYRKSIAIYRQLPKRFAGRMAVALLNLGLLLTNSGKFDEGLKTILEADAILTRPDSSFAEFESKAYLCLAYYNRNDYAAAIKYGQRSIEIGRKLGVTEAADFLNDLKFVGLSMTRTGQAREGEPLLREHLATTKRLVPNGSPLLASSEGALGECLIAQNRFVEAEPLVVDSFESLRVSQGEKSPLTVAAAKRAVTLYEKMKKPAAAAKYRGAVPAA